MAGFAMRPKRFPRIASVRSSNNRSKPVLTGGVSIGGLGGEGLTSAAILAEKHEPFKLAGFQAPHVFPSSKFRVTINAMSALADPELGLRDPRLFAGRFNLAEPDYTRPLLELISRQRQDITYKLVVLYGKERAEACFEASNGS